MRIAIIAAVASLTIASAASAQDCRYYGDCAYARQRHAEDRAYDTSNQHWSQFYGRSYSDGDLWTPNSANGS